MKTIYRITNDRYSNDATEATFEQIRQMCTELWGDCGLYVGTHYVKGWGTYDAIKDGQDEVVALSVDSINEIEN